MYFTEERLTRYDILKQITFPIMPSPFLGNYGNQIDGVSKPVIKKKKGKGQGEDEESELIHNSSDEEAEEDGDLASVSSTPPMKPMVTDRSVSQEQCWCMWSQRSKVKESVSLCLCHFRCILYVGTSFWCD